MKHFWIMLWAGLGAWFLVWVTDGLALGFRAAIVLGGVAGLIHTYYNYEEIACTCDDPDHEHLEK